MCSSEEDHQTDDTSGDFESDSSAHEADGINRVVGPLTDSELKAGGLDRVVAFVRSAQSAGAARAKRHRKKQKGAGRKQMNVFVPDNEASRATIKAAANAIDDEVCHNALDAILADEGLRGLVVEMTARAELRQAAELSCISDPSHLSNLLALLQGPAEAVSLACRVSARRRIRETVELAVSSPKFVLLGRKLATARSPSAWLARRLLRVRRQQPRPTTRS